MLAKAEKICKLHGHFSFTFFFFQCTVLNEKLNLLLNALSIESEALPPSAENSGNSGNGAGKQKVFVPRDALMSRANSLKKALKQIIEHAEQGKELCHGNNSVRDSAQERTWRANEEAEVGPWERELNSALLYTDRSFPFPDICLSPAA